MNYTYRFKFGATTVLTGSLLGITTSGSRRKWYVDITVVVESTTAQRFTAHTCVTAASALTMPTSSGSLDGVGYGTAAENTAGALNAVLTIEMGTAAATADCVLHAASVELLRKV